MKELSIYFGIDPWVIICLVLSILVLKTVAMWIAAKRNNLTVFIVLMILQTLGLAETIYLLYTYIKDRKQHKLVQ